jgi:glycosyltransferase involved in cell wall biosynthesis
VLLTVHSIVSADARVQRTESLVFDIFNRLQEPVSTLIERRLFGMSDQITTVSGAAARDMQSLLLEVGKHVEITWNGVDTGFFLPGGETPEPDTLLFVGRLAPGKGLANLLDAMTPVIKSYPGTKLLIAGEGPLHGKIRSLIDQRGLARQIQLLGQVDSRERLRGLYQKAWALVLPSHHESMPTVVLEAMACGSPVVSTAVGSVPEVITDGANGLLVPPRQPKELAYTICRLLGDAGLRARLGVAARSTVERRFSWQTVGSSYLRCYQELL